MEHGRHTDYAGCLPDHVSHFHLSGIYVPDHLRQRTVVPDRPSQDKGNALLYAAIHNPVADLIVLDKLGDRSASSHLIDYVQMIIVPVGLRLLRIDILSQRRMEKSPFQIMRRQRVPRHQAVRIAVLHQRLHGVAGILVKGKRGPHHPDNVSMPFFIF